MAWPVDFTPEAAKWLTSLPPRDRAKIARRVEKVRQFGPTHGRPDVDTVHGSRHTNMKEVRVPRTGLRALFAFGPDQRALVLDGTAQGKNDKSFNALIKSADKRLDDHLRTFERGSACRGTRAGTRSAASSR